ncbi:DUF1661 domain-containing protein [Porphyromonas gulae]|uniref:DUF1661 domain-containing protein n=1 Tax=Porphyromonas gulae TaxID=111105 RepID=UPI00374499D0
MSFLKTWRGNFFVLAREFFTSHTRTKKFPRHVFGDHRSIRLFVYRGSRYGLSWRIIQMILN